MPFLGLEIIRIASLIPESLAPCKNDQYLGSVASPANKSLGLLSEGRGWPVTKNVFSVDANEAAL